MIKQSELSGFHLNVSIKCKEIDQRKVEIELKYLSVKERFNLIIVCSTRKLKVIQSIQEL